MVNAVQMTDTAVRYSKFLSYVLRHKPESIGLQLDANGWASVDDLVARAGNGLTHALVTEIVRTNSKQRFALSDDGAMIRANQGHSVEVDLALTPAAPPETLFHGTARRTLDAIRAAGLSKMSRHHVHLSADAETATTVGARYGPPVVLEVRAGEMHRAGAAFFRAQNGVWLTDAVPPEQIRFPE